MTGNYHVRFFDKKIEQKKRGRFSLISGKITGLKYPETFIIFTLFHIFHLKLPIIFHMCKGGTFNIKISNYLHQTIIWGGAGGGGVLGKGIFFWSPYYYLII
jgi:hypothetical protein